MSKLKSAIVATMDRDVLRAVVDHLELDGVDRRSREEMAAAVSRAHRATTEVLLEFLYEGAVKWPCAKIT